MPNADTQRLHDRLGAYVELARLDRPVGTLLLLWPTLAALWLAAGGWPATHLIVVFTVGTFVMRSAGCVINDYADRGWDRHVARTRDRPLTSGRVSERGALLMFSGLCCVGAALLLFVNPLTRVLALVGFGLAVVYPFAKRWTYLPQVVLGAAFSWAIVMAFASVLGRLPSTAWLMFVGSLLWIVAYDTEYAMVDRDDDLEVGIKSTAILFGSADRFMVALLQACALLAFSLLGTQLELGASYRAGLVVSVLLFLYQQRLMHGRSRDGCFKAFRNNTWVGFALFAGVVLDTLAGNGGAPS